MNYNCFNRPMNFYPPFHLHAALSILIPAENRQDMGYDYSHDKSGQPKNRIGTYRIMLKITNIAESFIMHTDLHNQLYSNEYQAFQVLKK